LAKTANLVCAYMGNPAIVGVSGAGSAKALSDLAAAANGRAGNVLFPNACHLATGYRAGAIGTAGPDGASGFLFDAREVRPGVARVQVRSFRLLAQEQRFIHPDRSGEALFPASPVLLHATLNDARGASLDVTVLTASLVPVDGINADAPADHHWPTQAAYLGAKRTAEARWLAQWLQARQQANPSEKLVVLGDFHADGFDDGHGDLPALIAGGSAIAPSPTTRVAATTLIDVGYLLAASERYSSVFEGNARATSHILVDGSLLRSGYHLRIERARVNADFGVDNFDDFRVPVRTSPEDPTVLSLDPR
jgi:hypothetical protein